MASHFRSHPAAGHTLLRASDATDPGLHLHSPTAHFGGVRPLRLKEPEKPNELTQLFQDFLTTIENT
jgi:hypothetical protein